MVSTLKEVARECAGSLCSKELRLRRSRSSRSWCETVTTQDVAHACRRDRDTELCALADDPEIAPPGVLTRKSKDESDHIRIERVGGNRLATRVGPMPTNELPVPAQQRYWRHEEGCPTLTRQPSRQRCEYSAIGRGEPGSCYLAAQHRELMTKHRDLDVLLVRRRTDSNEAEQLSNEQEGDRTGHSGDRCTFATPLVRGRILRLHPTDPKTRDRRARPGATARQARGETPGNRRHTHPPRKTPAGRREDRWSTRCGQMA